MVMKISPPQPIHPNRFPVIIIVIALIYLQFGIGMLLIFHAGGANLISYKLICELAYLKTLPEACLYSLSPLTTGLSHFHIDSTKALSSALVGSSLVKL